MVIFHFLIVLFQSKVDLAGWGGGEEDSCLFGFSCKQTRGKRSFVCFHLVSFLKQSGLPAKKKENRNKYVIVFVNLSWELQKSRTEIVLFLMNVY